MFGNVAFGNSIKTSHRGAVQWGRCARCSDGALATTPSGDTWYRIKCSHPFDRLVRVYLLLGLAVLHIRRTYSTKPRSLWSIIQDVDSHCNNVSRPQSVWRRYATFAALAEVSTANTGPVQPDGYVACRYHTYSRRLYYYGEVAGPLQHTDTTSGQRWQAVVACPRHGRSSFMNTT